MSSLLDKAIHGGDIFKVEMNTVHFISFRDYRGIGTSDLNSCTAVMIVSSSGAILAHIAPRPPFARLDDPYAGDRHVTEKMDKMGTLYQQHKKHFSADKPSWIKSLSRSFKDGDLIPLAKTTNVVKAPLPPNGKGTVFIDAREGGFPIVYVEDRQVNRNSLIPQAQTYPLPQLQGSAYPQQDSTYPLPHDYAISSQTLQAASSSQDYASSSQTLQAASSSQAPKPGQAYYYVSNKIYYYCHSDGQVMVLDKYPDKIWVYNENGWSKSPNCKWRRTNGTNAKNAEYSQ